ncbi:MAG: VPLPA-CTERM sorting domain-containing protein [Candidatus Thiodiazotropha lotti]|uniref:VPLPA-CTERM sorting domain-containing protein n=1 Tax=Candidatus Thiodiazotropha lotti TaxID=2792787 RepID=A0A9E4N0Y3_9GAMM|nr:VPLPA-CTERM sorting domain-containing protein [Candidatus Thiodiazotropha lotti]MCW4204855.1 VPLPA-CTERM sorting domain-containing protein [Candidatus Thiodiazotropha lotti]
MLRRLSIHFLTLASIIGLGLWFTTASAAILSPGSNITLNGTTLATDPNLAGTVVHENLIGFTLTDPSGATLLTGNYLDRVIRSTNTDQLIFSGRIQDLANVGSSSMGVLDWSVSGFGGYQTDVEYRTDDLLGDIGPETALRSSDGDNVIFDFFIELEPPETSLPSSIATDATLFDLTGTAFLSLENLISGEELEIELDGLAAPSAVPLPAAFWMFGSGLIGLIGFQRQRRKS